MKLLKVFVCAVFSLQLGVSYGSSGKPALNAHQTGVLEYQKQRLLETLGDLLEVGVPMPPAIFTMAPDEDTEDAITSLSQILQQHSQESEDTLDSEAAFAAVLHQFQEMVEELLEGLDQYQKQELFLSICSQLIPRDSVTGEETDEECMDLFCNLFAPEHQAAIRQMMEQFSHEGDLITAIANTGDEQARISAIRNDFPENRQQGALAQLENVVQLNNLSLTLEKLSEALNKILNT